jgi:hypothetical protein
MKSIGSGGQQVTAEKVEESSFLDDLWQKLKGLADIVMMMKDTVLKIAEKLGMQVARGLATAGRWAVGAAQAFAASGGATVAGVVAAGGLITYGATNVLSNMSDEQREQLIKGDVGSDTSLAAAALNSAKSPQEADAYNKAVKKYQDYLSDAPFFTKYYGTKESVGDYLRNVAKIPKKDLDEFEKFELIAPAPTAQPVKKNPPPAPAAPQAPEGMQFDAEGNVNSAPAPQPQPKPKPAPAAPVPAEPKSAPVSNLTNNNINMGLTPIPKSDNMETVTRTTVNNMKNTQGKSGLRPIEISVRNDEPTFMDLIVQSTRII